MAEDTLRSELTELLLNFGLAPFEVADDPVKALSDYLTHLHNTRLVEAHMAALAGGEPPKIAILYAQESVRLLMRASR